MAVAMLTAGQQSEAERWRMSGAAKPSATPARSWRYASRQKVSITLRRWTTRDQLLLPYADDLAETYGRRRMERAARCNPPQRVRAILRASSSQVIGHPKAGLMLTGSG